MIRKTMGCVLAAAFMAGAANAGGPVGGSVETKVASMYEWNGFNRVELSGLEDGPVVQPRVVARLGESGLSVSAEGSFVMNDSREMHEAVYGVFVQREASPVANVSLGYNYYDNRVSEIAGVPVPDFNTHEIWGTIELKNATGVRPVATYKHEKSSSESHDGYTVLMAGLKHSLPMHVPSGAGGVGVDVSWMSNVVYNSGVRANNVQVVKRGVSAVQFGLETPVHAGPLLVTPTANYQLSIEDTVSKDNQFWASLGVAYAF
jgi:hypothetical protein